jgi:hypothetical protein
MRWCCARGGGGREASGAKSAGPARRLDKDTVTDEERVAEELRKEQIDVDH